MVNFCSHFNEITLVFPIISTFCYGVTGWKTEQKKCLSNISYSQPLNKEYKANSSENMHTTEINFFPIKNKTFSFFAICRNGIVWFGSVRFGSNQKTKVTPRMNLNWKSRQNPKKKYSLHDVIIYGNETNTYINID